MLMMIIFGLLIGFVFGFCLEKGRVFEPGLIVGQMQMKRFIMIKFFFMAIATSLLSLSLLNILGYKIGATSYTYLQSIVGGVLLGAGITIAGACPGTMMAQLGAGYKDAWFTIAGGFFGALFFCLFKNKLNLWLDSSQPIYASFSEQFAIPFWGIAIPAAIIIFVFLFFLEAKTDWRKDLKEDGTGIVKG